MTNEEILANAYLNMNSSNTPGILTEQSLAASNSSIAASLLVIARILAAKA